MRHVIATLLVLGLLGMGTAQAQSPSTPFAGSVTFDGGTDLPANGQCPVSHHRSIGTGHATHLGVFAVTSTTCGFNPRVVTSPPFEHGGAPPYFVADFTNEQAWSLANGDRLFISSAGVIVISLADGSRRTRGSVSVDGGTGRFIGATGEGSAAGSTGGGFSFSGFIDYQASNRATG